ncbi:MAG: sugar phosphate isomerase/epimerase [Chloroflexi bacterium]|nr:sugar phosphate isomerase/epimerase [Chloroflexota bacterium]
MARKARSAAACWGTIMLSWSGTACLTGLIWQGNGSPMALLVQWGSYCVLSLKSESLIIPPGITCYLWSLPWLPATRRMRMAHWSSWFQVESIYASGAASLQEDLVKLGAVEYIIQGSSDAITFARAKTLGFQGLEIMVTRQQLHAIGWDRLEHLKNAQVYTGLQIPSLMLSEHNQGGIAHADSEVAQAAFKDIQVAIDWAAELGAAVILVPFFGRGEIITAADFERAVQAFRELCRQAAAGVRTLGVTVCYEGTLPAADIIRMAGAVDSPAFGCYFDLGNVVGRGMDTATEMRALGPLVRQVHIKDICAVPGPCHPGQGFVDFVESARTIREIAYDGWLVLETPAGPNELVARDISFTRSHFPLPGAAWPQVGAFSWEFKQGELPRLISSFQAYGLTAVQLSGEILVDALAEPTKIPGMRTDLDAAGITVAALGAYRNLVAPDAIKRRANIAFVKRCLETGPEFGTAVVATETGTRHPGSDWQPVHENWDKASWDLLRAALDELLPVAEERDMMLALEGYVNNVLQTPHQLALLLEQYPNPHLQVVLDPFNYLSSHLLPVATRTVAQFLERFEPHFVLAHLKDVSAAGAEMDTPEFGTGVFPHKLYLDFLRTRRPDLPVILEHLPFDRIPAAIQRIHAIADS